jgi:hypothetical protein
MTPTTEKASLWQLDPSFAFPFRATALALFWLMGRVTSSLPIQSLEESHGSVFGDGAERHRQNLIFWGFFFRFLGVLTVKMTSFLIQMTNFEFKLKMWTNQALTRRYGPTMPTQLVPRSVPTSLAPVRAVPTDLGDRYRSRLRGLPAHLPQVVPTSLWSIPTDGQVVPLPTRTSLNQPTTK